MNVYRCLEISNTNRRLMPIYQGIASDMPQWDLRRFTVCFLVGLKEGFSPCS